MLALYRTGRRAEALEVYQRARRLLVDNLGIEPNRQLQELQQAVLAADPALDLDRCGAPVLCDQGPDRPAGHGEADQALTYGAQVDRHRRRRGRSTRAGLRTSTVSAADPTA
jgi:Bacterial transcriptional activator domain